MKNFKVKKRNGISEEFNIEKITKVVKWATENIAGVSASDIEINAKLNIRDGITTREIHGVIIEAAANLISLDEPNYQYVSARLLNYQLRKDVWGGKNAPKLLDYIKSNIKRGLYDKRMLEWYSVEEINKIDEFLDHDRDLEYEYASIKQYCDKYAVQNRSTKEIYETPQFTYVLVALCLFHKYTSNRLEYVKRAYNYFSKRKINLATPVLAGVRTNLLSFASCCLIDMNDTKGSINATNTAVAMATANRYGIGVNYGRIRTIGAPIRNGEAIHPGKVPFLKITEANTKAWQQNALRGGSATVTIPIWDYEIETVIQLKNIGGTNNNRVFNLDYSISISKLFYERFLKNEDVTLFSSHEVPDLYEAFGLPEFDDLYKKYEADTQLEFKKKIKARELFSLLTKERIETGRIYILNIDHANHHSPWLDKVNMANLCMEITTPMIPMEDFNDPNGEIGICILAAINWLEITSDTEFEKVCDVTVRMLDELIDYQNYFNKSAENFATKRRSLGIGITNLAAFLAKRGVKYEDVDAPNVVDEMMEKQQYYLLKSGVELAKEKGKCEKFDRTKYANGILPIDTYKSDIDSVITRKPTLDWDLLRKDIVKHGLRNSTYTAQMPCESSSLIQNATNGIEPIRSYITYKVSKVSTIPVIAPHYISWKNKYTLAFDMKDNIGYLNICAALQKWMDMSISVNMYYNVSHYADKKIPHSQIIKETLHHYKMGGKSIYYTNTEDGNKVESFDEKPTKKEKVDRSAGCDGDACAI